MFKASEEMAAVRREVAALPGALAEWVGAGRWPVVSVLLDGSWIRGDFWPGVSDLDVTVTFAGEAPGMAEGLIAIQEWLDKRTRAFPPRPAGRRTLRFDVQGQTLDEVTTTARRPLSAWSADDVPTGYPKLWLYAFDGIRHHTVLYGEDVTERYTRLPPAAFVPIRLMRLGRAVAALGDGVSDYDRAHGTISQMKNAWEILRAIHLARSGTSITKNDVLETLERDVSNESLGSGIRRIAEFYRDGVIPYPGGEPAFRQALHRFAREALTWAEQEI